MLRIPVKKVLQKLWGLALLSLLSACGRSGELDQIACVLCGQRNNITGSIATMDGRESLNGHVIAAFEKDTGIARVGEVNASGVFTLQQVRTDKAHTLVLLNSNFILTSVLSIPTPQEKKIKQFFFFKSKFLPKLVQEGLMIKFQNDRGISVSKETSDDADGNKVPDGFDAQSITSAAALTDFSQPPSWSLRSDSFSKEHDQDSDGVPNISDPDIDNDGLINAIDMDDDNDDTGAIPRLLDIFDDDQNGDLITVDSQGLADSDLYYKEGLEFLAVQFALTEHPDIEKQRKSSLRFTAKLREMTPLQLRSVEIRGPAALLNGATWSEKKSDCSESTIPWSPKELTDNGLNEMTRVKQVSLKANASPEKNQLIFFQLKFGPDDQPWAMEFPFMFADVKANIFSGSYRDKTFSRSGSPFENSEQYDWFVNLWEEDKIEGEAAASPPNCDATLKRILWSSTPQPGSSAKVTLPTSINLDKTTKSYYFDMVAQTKAKIPGFPPFVVYSKLLPIDP